METLIEQFHDMLDNRVESGISDHQKYDVIKLLCDLLGCKVPDSVNEYHLYWLKDYVQ